MDTMSNTYTRKELADLFETLREQDDDALREQLMEHILKVQNDLVRSRQVRKIVEEEVRAAALNLLDAVR